MDAQSENIGVLLALWHEIVHTYHIKINKSSRS